MKNLEKYHGIIPAFYACYDEQGEIDVEAVEKLAKHYLNVGVKGLYVGGSSGECVYQNVAERKLVLEHVMKAVGNDMTIIAHIAAASTRDSIELAKHAEKLKVNALAGIPPIYYGMSEQSISDYWNSIIDATELDFIIYNIPQTTNYQLSRKLYLELLENEKVIGVKNSSMPVQDILVYKHYATKDVVIFNGPDEQFVAGRIMGADGGIGGTYGAMPELFLAMDHAVRNKNYDLASEIQVVVFRTIDMMVSCEGNLYAVIKRLLSKDGIEIGGVREPLKQVTKNDTERIEELYKYIKDNTSKYKI